MKAARGLILFFGLSVGCLSRFYMEIGGLVLYPFDELPDVPVFKDTVDIVSNYAVVSL